MIHNDVAKNSQQREIRWQKKPIFLAVCSSNLYYVWLNKKYIKKLNEKDADWMSTKNIDF